MVKVIYILKLTISFKPDFIFKNINMREQRNPNSTLQARRDYGAGRTYYPTMINDIDEEQCLIVNSDFDAG